MSPQASREKMPPQLPLDLNKISLQGQKIILRAAEAKDYPALQKLCSDPITMNQLQWMAYLDSGGWSYDQVRERYEDRHQQQEKNLRAEYLVCDKVSGKILGDCGFNKLSLKHKNAEFGILIDHRFWGTGITEECFLLCLGFGFSDLGLHRIELQTLTTHVRMRSFLEKIGIQLEGIKKDYVFDEGTFKDNAVYVLFTQDWPEVKKHLQHQRAKKLSLS